MKVSWNQTTRSDWEAFCTRQGASLQQSWGYGQAMRSLGVQVHRASVEDGGELRGLAQFVCRRVAGYLSLASCSRGPVWHSELQGGTRAEAYRALKQSIPTRALRVTLLSPDTDLPAPGEVAHLSRVMTGYSTVMLDLRRDLSALRADLDGKWRNRLVKAEEDTRLRIEVQADRPGCERLLQREDEQRASRGFHGLPTELVPAYIAAHDKPSQAFVLASARLGKGTVATMLFLIHGKRASYHMGWSDDEGRKLNTHNLLLWRAVVHFHSLGFEQLDLGGVNTHDLPGISRFKLGTGGRVLTLAGTYF
jgi:hypothetical protein